MQCPGRHTSTICNACLHTWKSEFAQQMIAREGHCPVCGSADVARVPPESQEFNAAWCSDLRV